MRILIAEDDLISRKYLHRLLQSYGECDLTSNGIEAVDAYFLALEENHPYELICLDIMMPKLDGIRAFEIIRKNERGNTVFEAPVPIIMTTALSESPDVFGNYATGNEYYLTKPFDIGSLTNAMRTLKLIK